MTSSIGEAKQQPGETIRCALATPLDSTAVQVVMWTEGPEQQGPWSFVTDVPSDHKEALGPPPIYLALAGWAT